MSFIETDDYFQLKTYNSNCSMRNIICIAVIAFFITVKMMLDTIFSLLIYGSDKKLFAKRDCTCRNVRSFIYLSTRSINNFEIKDMYYNLDRFECTELLFELR